MKNDTENNSEFKFFEPKRRGKMPYVNKYPGSPIVKITQALAAISENAQVKMGLNKKSVIGFSEKEGTFYISCLPFDSKINGFKLHQMGETKTMYIQCKPLIKLGFATGYYQIGEVVHNLGIDWFELEPFEY